MTSPVSRRPRSRTIDSTEPQRVIVDRLVDNSLRGLLFIGDPHIASYSPGRRIDESYLDTVLGKLRQCAQWARERQLLPVSPGDLVDDHDDNDPTMHYRTIQTLHTFDPPMVTTVGNHDKKERQLTEKAFLALLGLTGSVDLVAEPGFWGRVTLSADDGRTHRLVLGFTPYGFPPPKSLAEALGLDVDTPVDEARALAQADTVLWITHGDFAFEGAYPGAAPLVEIPGVDVVINGHMHGAKKPVQMGQTVWHNPGNIVRMSVDMADEAPSAWVWSPFDAEAVPSVSGVRVHGLEQLVLDHTPGIRTFSLEGRHAVPTLLTEAAAALGNIETAPLLFTEGMKQVRADLRSGDGTGMKEDLVAVMGELNTPDRARTILDGLAQRAARAVQVKDAQT
jgi:hypothetical protein